MVCLMKAFAANPWLVIRHPTHGLVSRCTRNTFHEREMMIRPPVFSLLQEIPGV